MPKRKGSTESAEGPVCSRLGPELPGDAGKPGAGDVLGLSECSMTLSLSLSLSLSLFLSLSLYIYIYMQYIYIYTVYKVKSLGLRVLGSCLALYIVCAVL